MIKYLFPAMLFVASPAFAQQAALNADQWRNVAQSYRSELIQLQGQQDDSNAQISLLQQQISQLQSQLSQSKHQPSSSIKK
jgi:phage shock protein A